MAVISLAQGSRSQLQFKQQTALGAVASGNYTRLRYKTHTLDVNKSIVTSGEIRPNREQYISRHGNRHAVGDITAELVFGDHDKLIEAAMFSAFTTDFVVLGTTPKYLSIEDGQLDISQYRMFQDMLVDKMAFDFKPNAMVDVSWSFVGTDGAANTASTGGGTIVEPSTNQPFDTWNGALFDDLAESGSELAFVTSCKIDLNNNISPAFALGQAAPVGLEYGKALVTGEFTAYYQNQTLINRFLNETAGVLVINITDPTGNVMEFRMGNIRYNGAKVPVANESARIITIPFVALYDPTTTTALKISKV